MKADFEDRRGRRAGTLAPVRLTTSVRDAVLSESKTKGCWFAYGLSIMDGYHSVLLLVDRTGAEAKIYWLDQFSSGLDEDVTNTLDQRLTEKTQHWWRSVMEKKRRATKRRFACGRSEKSDDHAASHFQLPPSKFEWTTQRRRLEACRKVGLAKWLR